MHRDPFTAWPTPSSILVVANRLPLKSLPLPPLPHQEPRPCDGHEVQHEELSHRRAGQHGKHTCCHRHTVQPSPVAALPQRDAKDRHRMGNCNEPNRH